MRMFKDITKVNIEIKNEMAMGNKFEKQEQCMKVNGLMIKCRDLVVTFSLNGIIIMKDNGKIQSKMDQENMFIRMVVNYLVILQMVKKKDTLYKKDLLKIVNK